VIADVGHEAHHHASVSTELILMAISVVVAVTGILIAKSIWKTKGLTGGEAWAERWPRVHDLLLEKYRVDELYQTIVVGPLAAFSRFCRNVIDGILVEGAVHTGPFIARLAGDVLRFTTTGNVRNYLLYFFVGLLVLFWWVVR
jgi:NADH-quinone oxidoreductase subunit L